MLLLIHKTPGAAPGNAALEPQPRPGHGPLRIDGHDPSLDRIFFGLQPPCQLLKLLRASHRTIQHKVPLSLDERILQPALEPLSLIMRQRRCMYGVCFEKLNVTLTKFS